MRAARGSLLVLIVEGTVPGKSVAADSCVRSRSCKVVRRNGRTNALAEGYDHFIVSAC